MNVGLPILDGHLLTHSSEQAFRLCPRKYQLGYVLGLRPRHDGDALRIGDAFHVGIEAVKKGKSEQEAENDVRDKYAATTRPPWMEPDDFATEEEMAVGMVRAWCRKWSGDQVIRYVAAELVFDLPLVNPYTGRPHPTLRNAGKIDGVGELPDGRLALVEHKTTSDDISTGSDYWRRLLMDHQVSRYFLAARELGYDVVTTAFDVTRKPQVRPKKLAKTERASATHKGDYLGVRLSQACPERETPQMFGARLLADMMERPDHYFARNEIPRLQSDLEQFKLDQWFAVKAITSCELDGYWPRNTGACLVFGRCQYLDICRGMTADPQDEIPDGFKRAERLHPELAPQAPALAGGST